MAALVAMLVQPAPDASALQTEAAAKLLNALLGVDVLAAGGDFCAAGGMAALRALISNAPDGPAVRTWRWLHSPVRAPCVSHVMVQRRRGPVGPHQAPHTLPSCCPAWFISELALSALGCEACPG
jgi:hypothetical protein